MTGRIKKAIIIPVLSLLAVFALAGCRKNTDTQYVLTTGFKEDEVFKIKDRSCYLPEVMVYLVNIQDQYEEIYGEEIWDIDPDKLKLDESVKDNVLAQISQIKAMNILADENNITLDEKELKKVREAADEYTASLNDAEKEKMHLKEDTVYNMYCEYALAYKYYHEIIKDIDLEISDDEARTITIEHIFIKTYRIDPDGKRTEFTPEEKEDALRRADSIHELATDGRHDFTDLVLQYTEGDTGEYSFSKGDTDKTFEDAAFNLGKDEISDVISTINGYHIIKCISTFNKEETEQNKVKISQLAREKVFGENYDEYVKTLTTYLNEELWDSIQITPDENVKTKSFFDIYHKYMD